VGYLAPVPAPLAPRRRPTPSGSARSERLLRRGAARPARPVGCGRELDAPPRLERGRPLASA